jgi:hypothetical protein
MERGPFSYTDPARIENDLRAAGFEVVEIETVELASRVSARDAAYGIVLGSPFRGESNDSIHRLSSARPQPSSSPSETGTAETHRSRRTSRPRRDNRFRSSEPVHPATAGT